MNSPIGLAVGDEIRIVSVPQSDLLQRARNRENDIADNWIPTADVLEELIASKTILKIDRIDEYGYPCFEYGEHSIAIMDAKSWEKITRFLTTLMPLICCAIIETHIDKFAAENV